MNAGHVFWTNTSTIGRANLDGTGPNQTFIGGTEVSLAGMALGPRYLYWSDVFSGAIGRAALNGRNPAPGFIGGATRPQDVEVDALAAACAGSQATIVGTGRPDKLRGTSGDDVIAAGRGDDRVAGLGGDDLICGAGGDDTLRGGTGDDVHRGGGGSNTCRGGPGSDRERRC